jgi:tetratricopeptide (TPR) repeat protein
LIPTHAEISRPKMLPARVQLIFLLLVLLAYANSFHNGFHFDDFHTIVDNPAIRSLHNLPRFFTDTATFSVLPANRTYRPIVSSTLALDYALGRGYNPLWFHLGTFALFLLLLLLLEELALRLFTLSAPTESSVNRWLALLTAAWFGLHPAMAETVNYIIQRGDLYCTLGVFAAFVLFTRYPSLRRTGLYLIPLALALLSKPPAAVFPVLLLFYLYFFEQKGRHRLRRSLFATLPSVALVSALVALQAAMTPKTFAPSTIPFWQYALTQPFVWMRYCGQFFLPLHLNIDTDLAPFTTPNARALLGFVFLLGFLATIALTARQRRTYPIAYGLLWFLLTQLPTSLFPLSEVENDHRMFFSFPGLMWAVVWAAWLTLQRFTHTESRKRTLTTALAVSVALLLAYGIGVHQRNKVWLNEESLWRDDVAKSPHNGRGWMIFGLTQMSKGDYTQALNDFHRAERYTPRYPTLTVNLGVVNAAIADNLAPTAAAPYTAEAIRYFQRAIALAPADDVPHTFYGQWLLQHHQTQLAIDQLRLAVTLNPARLMQREELLSAYSEAGDITAALQAAHALLAIDPTNTTARQCLAHPPTQNAAFWINLSLAQYQHGEYQASIASAQHALTFDPNSPEAYNNIGAANAQLHRWDQAIAADQHALALMPSFQLAYNNLHWAQSQKALSR